MIGMNIRVLRKKHKLNQEQLAEKVDVSRQTVAKWESGEAVPDIYKGKILADIFQITLDQLSRDMSEEETKRLAPKGRQFFGVVKVGEGRRERGQIVIPKQARDMYQIQAGDKLVILGEDATKGIAVLKTEGFLQLAEMIEKAELADGDIE
ncbi:AbrB family transcriptional regulator [Lederbergia galactosidilytica]|uniref:AbrB family transcriptional regulator n=1 Tax=Lederbergia galactosidilytica TaxID=217031 RepID=A0A0Q9Y7A8_9BACI|nr:AbrB family transcriptional regulator [Lederbergia galactosidilytica]